MQRTVNYDLCQYEGSDKTSYLINYNGDMLKIDTAIKGAKDAADNAQSKANTADGKADANAASISTLDTQINGAGGVAADVSSLQGSVNTINSLIGSGEPTTQDKTIIGAINELAGEIPQGGTSAADVSFDGATSGLTADDVQEAIDEVVAMIPSVTNPDADDVSYDNTDSGLTATNVQDAIDELALGHVTFSSTERKVGTFNGDDVFEKTISANGPFANNDVLDATLTDSYVKDILSMSGGVVANGRNFSIPLFNPLINPEDVFFVNTLDTGLCVTTSGNTVWSRVVVTVRYTKEST